MSPGLGSQLSDSVVGPARHDVDVQVRHALAGAGAVGLQQVHAVGFSSLIAAWATFCAVCATAASTSGGMTSTVGQ